MMSGSAPPADGGTAEAGGPGGSTVDYREKPVSTLVRVMTVLAYLFSVSFAAILLSIYYICVWKSPVLANLKLTDEREMLDARRGELSDYSSAFTDQYPHNLTGGSDTPVNETATPPTLDNISNFTNTDETAETIVDYAESLTSMATEQDYARDANETLDVTTVT